ncbi:hypothetical protein ACIQF6_28430 [Kitasatospora sp. NPDC092948]|uniref:hypothetical protein n=1 Tax=Kitasatospora sp. NPDC092948 TaxID=3364088 RepID=UPI0037F23DAD
MSIARRGGLGRRPDLTAPVLGPDPGSPRATLAGRVADRREDLTPEQQVLIGRSRRRARTAGEAARLLLPEVLVP